MATGVNDGKVYVWEVATGALQFQLEGHHSNVSCVSWSPDGRKLASAGSGGESGELFIWDMQSGKRVRSIDTDLEASYIVCWGSIEGSKSDRHGEALVSGGRDGTLRWWNVGTGESEIVHHAHASKVEALKRSPDGTRLASCGDDGAIMIWDLGSGEHLQTLRRDRPYERLNITGIRGLTEAQKATLRALGAIEETRT